MDFSIKFIEMFEDRFGRRATTLLVALIGMAVALWCLSIVIGFAIRTYKVVSVLIPLGKIGNDISAVSSQVAFNVIITGVLNFIVGFLVFKYLIQPFVFKKSRQAINDGIAYVEQLFDNAVAERKRAESAVAEGRQVLAEVKQLMARTEAALSEPENKIASTIPQVEPHQAQEQPESQ